MYDSKPIILESFQIALREAIAIRNEKSAEMYIGALHALTNSDNPERMSQCAQSVREMISRLTFVKDDANLGSKVKGLKEEWEKHKNRKACPKISGAFSFELEIFFRWVDQSRPSIRVQAEKVINFLDPMAAELPTDIQNEKVSKWLNFRKFFEDVAHHNRYPDEKDFKETFRDFELFFLDLLRPKTTESISKIEQLIKEGEANA